MPPPKSSSGPLFCPVYEELDDALPNLGPLRDVVSRGGNRSLSMDGRRMCLLCRSEC